MTLHCPVCNSDVLPSQSHSNPGEGRYIQSLNFDIKNDNPNADYVQYNRYRCDTCGFVFYTKQGENKDWKPPKKEEVEKDD